VTVADVDGVRVLEKVVEGDALWEREIVAVALTLTDPDSVPVVETLPVAERDGDADADDERVGLSDAVSDLVCVGERVGEPERLRVPLPERDGDGDCDRLMVGEGEAEVDADSERLFVAVGEMTAQ
jgi:hypothetical protein